LVTIDPDSAEATPVGTSGLEERELYELAWCGDGLSSFVNQEGGDRLWEARIVDVDPTTGAATEGSPVDEALYGFDCEGTAGHVLSSDEPIIREARMAESYNLLAGTELSTIDLDTGAVTVGPTLTSSLGEVGIALLAIPTQAPDPEPTTTT